MAHPATWPYGHIMLKRCPFLRTTLHCIISHCWEKQTFSKTWKYAFTILVYKKGDKKVASNFRPITMQPVFAKVYSSLMRNRIYKFLLENNYIELKIQKGFWSDISGVIEHTEWTYIINHARKKQRQAIITLLDWQNEFGEVDHRLLLKVFDYHHVSVELKSLIKNYYHNYAISIETDNYVREFYKVIV